MLTITRQKKCSHCNKDTSRKYRYNSAPRFQIIGFTQSSQDVEVSKVIILITEAGPVTLGNILQWKSSCI